MHFTPLHGCFVAISLATLERTGQVQAFATALHLLMQLTSTTAIHMTAALTAIVLGHAIWIRRGTVRHPKLH